MYQLIGFTRAALTLSFVWNALPCMDASAYVTANRHALFIDGQQFLHS